MENRSLQDTLCVVPYWLYTFHILDKKYIAWEKIDNWKLAQAAASVLNGHKWKITQVD